MSASRRLPPSVMSLHRPAGTEEASRVFALFESDASKAGQSRPRLGEREVLLLILVMERPDRVGIALCHTACIPGSSGPGAIHQFRRIACR